MPFIILCIVATPFVFAAWVVNRVLKHRMQVKQLSASPVQPRALPAGGDDVQQRLANLEAIICSEDYELSRRVRDASGPRAA